MARVFISMGSNIDPERNLAEAVRRLGAQCEVIAVSPVYETAPVGRTDQANFLNAAALVETELDPRALKEEVLHAIERELGRVRTEDKNAPRTIDLDIALYGDWLIDSDAVRVPDPDIVRHAHVAVPLADLAPGFAHPETGRPLADITRGMPMDGLRRRDDISLGTRATETRTQRSDWK